MMNDSMHIAILGATSQIAKDLIVSFFEHTGYYCVLFSRSPEKVDGWLKAIGGEMLYSSEGYLSFPDGNYDAIINFVGVGDPARAKLMGTRILDITYQYDQLALDYVKSHPKCKYIFLSSGAVYGDMFDKPVDEESFAQININHLEPSNWYGIAKLYAEVRHRELPELSIVDIRVFNYFSHTQDIQARFLITDILRSIRDKAVFKTSSENIVRDFLHPDDFYQLIQLILDGQNINMPIDCYSKEPIDKLGLLSAMQKEFSLQYEITEPPQAINATGTKLFYFSCNHRATKFSFSPEWNSLETILSESDKILKDASR